MSNQLDFNHELNFRTSRSSGSGGQHVNKVETRVELLFDVKASAVLSDTQKLLVLRNLKNRINNEGVLILANSTERSQRRNKSLAVKRFYEMIGQAMTPNRMRRLTNTPRKVEAKRLKNKKQAGVKKALRKKVKLSDYTENDLF